MLEDLFTINFLTPVVKQEMTIEYWFEFIQNVELLNK